MYLEEYRKARQAGMKEAKRSQSRGCSPYLPVLDEILAVETTCGEVDLGVVEIPIELIVGTRSAGRSQAFSHTFLPLMEEDSEFCHKWTSLCKAHMDSGITDPIKAYEYMHTFYVVEGHKRVSVLRWFGAVSIPAEVTRILPAKDGSKASKIYYEYVDFYNLSKINNLWFSGTGRFARLQEAVGKAPDQVWTEEERRKFYSFYARFAALYGDKDAKELSTRLTVAAAMLLYLEFFGYDQVKTFSQTDLKDGFLQLHTAFSVKKSGPAPPGGGRPDPLLRRPGPPVSVLYCHLCPRAGALCPRQPRRPVRRCAPGGLHLRGGQAVHLPGRPHPGPGGLYALQAEWRPPVHPAADGPAGTQTQAGPVPPGRV